MKRAGDTKLVRSAIKRARLALAAALLIVPNLASPHAHASGGPPDSAALSGAWRWIRSFGGLLGADESPAASGFERVLYFGPRGMYEYVEQDSAHEYLLCKGRVAIHRYPNAGVRSGDSLAWLALDSWWVSYERNLLIWFINRDTLAAYPGSPGSGVDDALTHWFVRAGEGHPLAPGLRLPLSARPIRPPVERSPIEGQFVYYESPPQPIRKASPQYPALAREAGIEGTVVLHLLVGKDGRVKNVKVTRGVTGLNDAAVAAVKQWMFKPALSNNKPVAVWTEIEVRFPPSATLRDQTQDQRRESVSRLWPQWRFPDVSVEVREWAASQHVDPTVAYGDFDDDGEEDVAFMIQPETHSVSRKIVACLSSIGAAKPVVIEKPYCSDGIGTAQKGRRYYDYSTGLEGTYPKDGIHAYCFEKAGATYIFTNGSFREIVDSD